MDDKILRVLAKDVPVKASAITARNMVERARQIHKTLPTATAALGRALMACSMMGNQLKEDDGAVTLQIKGGGPLGSITVVSDSQGNARGYVQNPEVDLPLKAPGKLDVGRAVGTDGSLTVIKAVSYTHLDVYKRQAHLLPHRQHVDRHHRLYAGHEPGLHQAHLRLLH